MRVWSASDRPRLGAVSSPSIGNSFDAKSGCSLASFENNCIHHTTVRLYEQRQTVSLSNLVLQHGIQTVARADISSAAHEQVQRLDLGTAAQELLDIALRWNEHTQGWGRVHESSRDKHESHLAHEARGAGDEDTATRIEGCNLRLAVVHGCTDAGLPCTTPSKTLNCKE